MIAPLAHTERVAIARLHALLELLPTALDKQLSPTHLTSFEFTLLDRLSQTQDGRLRLTALAAQTNATLPRLSRVVSALARKGYVERVPCPHDGRATNAVLTQAGREVLVQATPLYEEAIRTMILDGLTADGVSDLADLSYSILTKLDPDHKLNVMADHTECSADPRPLCSADPQPRCAADPNEKVDAS